uniref:Solute carrier family 26 member 1 n=1 Tax=Hippocampus comes TaxID=109280 RepID=A0A3Q2XRW4_HIPCM
MITMSATALISVELGLLVGISFSLICIIYKTQNPRVSLLGRAGDSDLYEDMEEYQNLVPPSRVRVFRFQMTSRRKAEKKANGDTNNGDVVVALVQRQLDFHTIILDCSAIPFLDSTGLVAFQGLLKEFAEIGVRVVLACCNTSLIDTLQKGQLFGKGDKDMSKMLFHTVHHAILYANIQQPDKSSEDSVL